MLKINTIQQNAHASPRMVMQRPVIVTAQEVMQVHVEEPIARDQPPAAQIGNIIQLPSVILANWVVVIIAFAFDVAFAALRLAFRTRE